MNKLIWYLTVFAALTLMACESANTCINSDMEQFDSFLGIDAATMEVELPQKLGKFTGGYYSEDERQFIYNFKELKDVPVSVVVNASSSKVETVIMEVLSYPEDFDTDLVEAEKKYEIDPCDSRFFGMKRDELVTEMGEPAEEEVQDGNVTMLTYFSKDYRTEVRFKFYPEQDHVCSTVIVNWYH